MASDGNAQKAEEPMFEIELRGIERVFEPGFGTESYEVSFECQRDGESIDATVGIDAESVATLDIIPRAMIRLHKAFLALAEQTRAWLSEKP